VIPEVVDLSVNARVLIFTLVVGVGSGLLFGLAPIFHLHRRDTTATLRERGTAVNGARATSMRGAFVVLQMAVSLVLLVGAGLFVRTVTNAYSVELAYEVDQTLVASLNLEAHGYFEGGPRGPEAGLALYEQILSRVEALPGVVAAGAARMTVLSGGARSTAVSTDGRPLARDNSNALGVRANVVSHRYLDAMNIPILHGRGFDRSDGPRTARVTIVTRSLADQLWPHEDPIGKTVRDESNQLLAIVGVFGAIALVLAALGLYGVMAHAAAERTPEIGIRLAMGAEPPSIVTLLLGQGLRLLAIGAALGLTGALFVTRYIEAQLFGVTATDPLTFISGCVVLAVAGLTASAIPALRAMRVDPVIALRQM
jgi:predicted lysophospholipase L1 biosynthesis ABC-type transport system permease subunit